MPAENNPFEIGIQYQQRRLAYANQRRDECIAKLDKWLLESREVDNFTYDLHELNVAYLSSFVSVAVGVEVSAIEGYISELQNNFTLKEHIRRTISSSQYRWIADAEPRYGRRLGWYAIVRATKPKVIVETGIDKGLGSCVLATALMENAREGYPGRYYGVDINPHAGMLFAPPYSGYGQLVFRDAIAFLQAFEGKIDVHINDSDHSEDYEAREYETVCPKLTDAAVIIGDNAHCNDKLRQFAKATSRQFLFFQENPKDHMYPGAGIGVAFRHSTRESSPVSPSVQSLNIKTDSTIL